jgi:gliding motility-associated-like protein
MGTTTVTYTATDGSGNTSTCSFSVIVNDTSNPVIENCPTNITISANASCQAIVSWAAPTVSDNCSIANFTSNHNPGDVFPMGTTTVTYTATDGSGNTSACSFSVIVNDTSNPIISNCPEDITVSANASCQATVTWAAPTASDCSAFSLVASQPPGSLFTMGTTTVTYTATDLGGYASTCTFKVTVKNGSNPEVKGCPDDIIVNANENGTIDVSWTEPQGSVQCGGISVKKTNEPGSSFIVGTTPVLYEFTDDYGNSSSCKFNVNVLEYEALFAISKAVTPDGDGINDVWMLTNIEKYGDNTVLVVDRWGNKIYSATGYNNQSVVWNATNTNGAPVPTGTYFYKIEVQAQGKLILKTGFLEVIQ